MPGWGEGYRRMIEPCPAGVRKICIAQYLGRCIGVLLAQISRQDILAGARPLRDRLTNSPRSNDDNDITHDDALS
jgi:hypothetical protein